MITTYMGVRVSEREAGLLWLRENAPSHMPLPERIRRKADWLHEACNRVLDWQASRDST